MRCVRRGGVILVAVLLAGCSTARVDERMSYWRTQTAAQLPAGTPKAQASAFFESRGVPLKCCVSERRNQWLHFAAERGVGRSLWTTYDVVVLVELSADDRVTDIRVQRWGVGL